MSLIPITEFLRSNLKFNGLTYESLSRVDETKIQELLTCVFYDAYFNGKVKFNNDDDIIKYYNDQHDSIIADVANKSGLGIDKFDEFMIVPVGVKGTPKTNRVKWHKSFAYQCESFAKWIDKHPSFKTKLVFIHHDTAIGIENNAVTTDWKIAKRVKGGQSTFGISNKDNYQKADIYAVVHDVNVKPEKDITSEIAYWISAIDGESANKFIGISLKKLLKPIDEPHTYGLDNINIDIKSETISLNIPVFNNIQFNGNVAEANVGGTSSSLKFDANIGGKNTICSVDIRTSGCGAESRIIEKPNQAHTCFGCKTGAQLTMSGMGGQGGRMQVLLTRWMKKHGIDCKPKISMYAEASDFNKYISIINDACSKYGIKHDILAVSGASANLIDFLAHAADKFKSLLKAYNKSNHKLTSEIINQAAELGIEMNEQNYIDCFLAIFTAIKWKSAAYSALCQFAAIFAETDETSVLNVLRALVAEAKGISNTNNSDHLPYVMIG